MLTLVKRRLRKKPLFLWPAAGARRAIERWHCPVTTPILGGTVQSENRLAYWRANLRLVAICLAIWFICSYGFGVLLVEQMNTIRIGGFQLGFWFAQQGSIYIFVALIFFYAWRMNRIDRQYDVHED